MLIEDAAPMQLRHGLGIALVAAIAAFACGGGGRGRGAAGGDGGGPGGAGDRDGGALGSGGGEGGATPPGAEGGLEGDGGGPVTPPVPANNRAVYNFDYGWKFIEKDVTGAQAPAFDDSSWIDVTLPHTFNDVDSWVDWVGFATDTPIERRYSGPTWYRKHFTLDATFKDRKVFLEFQGIRNAGTFYVNGTKIGIHEDQISPCGLDVTGAVQFGADNVIAVQVTNDDLFADQTYVPGTTFDWSTQAFYPMYGGLYTDANLIVTDKIHQTLPLYRNLGTSGVYVHADNIDPLAKSATVTVEAEVANESAAAESVTLSFDLYDRAGTKVLTQTGTPQSVPAGGKATLTASAPMTGAHLWAPDFPYVYTARSSLAVGGSVVDIVDNPLGVRTFTFSATNGFKINGHSYFLAGFSPRTVMDWSVPGIPQDWMTEYDYLLMKQANAFFIRPMHVAPRKHMVESADQLGIIMVVPAGDGEGCYDATRWPQHLAVMQNVTIYFRNNPSVAFYEGCNSPLTQQQMLDMKAVRDKWDPHGGRFAGARGTDTTATPAYEYGSPMDGTGHSSTIPLWSAEYSREESPRRVWDKYTPVWDPHTAKFVTGGYINICSQFHVAASCLPNLSCSGNGIAEYPLMDFRQNSMEDMALANIFKYWAGYSLSNFVLASSARTSSGVQMGASKIFFADSDSDGRMKDTEVARVSGVVDGSRLPKSSFDAMRVAASIDPAITILGHWNYPAGTVKTVYVVANTDQVTLATYDPSGGLVKDYGQGTVDAQPGSPNHYVFAFPNVAFAPGKIKAIGTKGATSVSDEKVTAGTVAALKLTPVLGPKGWYADGADIAMVDVEAVDANGQRVPTDEADVAFSHSGAGQWMGGYNSGVRQSKFKDDVWTEAGINRLFVRSARAAGTFTITAPRPGLTPATLTLTSLPFPVDATGLTQLRGQRYSIPLGTEPTPVADPQ